VASGGGPLNSGPVLLRQSARYPVIVAALAGPDGSDLSLLVLSGQVNAAGEWSMVAVDRVSAVNGSLLGVDYRAVPSGYAGNGNFTGWVGQGHVRLLPSPQPYDGFIITAW
jgi:hypothetical protein